MRGAVFLGNRKVELRTFPDPAPGPGEVVIEMKASGMCGSDLKFYRSPPGAAQAALGLGNSSEPFIGGHEPCGVVVARGPGVSQRDAPDGQRVMDHHYAGCGTCPHCRLGWSQLCRAGITVYGVTAVILGLSYPLALAVLAGLLDLIPNIGATIAGIIIGIVALSVSVGALIAFVIVIVVYQQIENYVLQPTIIGKAANVSGFTVLASVLVFGALFGFIGAIIGVPIAAGLQIVGAELTAARRARTAAAEVAEPQPPA